MRVDVVDATLMGRHRHLHATHRAFPGRLHHIVAVRRRAVTGQFGENFRPACLGVFVFFQHQDAAAAGNDKAVAIGVVSA